MRQKRHQLLLGTLVAVLILAAGTNGFAYIMGNDGDVGFAPPPQGMESTATIKQLIATGAGSYLDSYSDFVLLLNRVELWDANPCGFNELQMLVNGAFTKMENARQTYSALNDTLSVTPYNETAVAKLLSLDFKAFRTANGLNSEIFDEVEADLSKGNIRAIFQQLSSRVQDISVTLNKVKEEIQANEFPSISLLWELNSRYTQTLLFGQYAAQVFNLIKQDM